VNVKDAVAGDDEAHFVFVVPVFAIEFGEHLVETRCCRVDVDDVGSHVTATRF